MKRVAIIGGRLIDPAAKLDGLFDIILMGGRIASIKPRNEKEAGETGKEDWEIIDATGMIVVPGLVDIHTHLREPGEEYKETIETGTRAASAGGFTTILSMANTEPVNDSASVTRLILRKAKEAGLANVFPVGSVSVGLKGESLSEFGELYEAGCVAVSDDGMPVKDGLLMRRALEYANVFSLPVISHAEDPVINAGGVMNEGETSTRLGLRGIPNASEDSMVARDIYLSELTGARLHIAHVSTKGAVELIRSAKKRGVMVTAEAAPHHLVLDDSSVEGYDTDAKMSPPLRSTDDVKALIKGLKDGTIDAVATDHAPHSTIEKDIEFDAAANGIVGLETALGLVLELVNGGRIDLIDALERMTSGPARVMGLDKGSLKVGGSADIAIIDLNSEWTVDPAKFMSRSKNTPFKGRALKGQVMKTILEGKVVFERQ
ncbi:MAG: dihydroorotase [Thermodesulfobacteriota bacterium]